MASDRHPPTFSIAEAPSFYAQNDRDLEQYIEFVFRKFQQPDTSARWIQAYIEPLHTKFTQLYDRRGTYGGLTRFMSTCVEMGIVDSLLSLAEFPRPEYKLAVYLAMDILHHIVMVASPTQRREILTQAAECNGLNRCLHMMENHELCLDRYAATRIVRAFALELNWAHLLKPAEAGEIIARLLRQATAGPDRFSEELRKPSKMWQIMRMIERRVSKPETAAEYGKRWFGICSELYIFSVHSLVCAEPRFSRQHLLEVAQSHPEIFDMLLDCAAQPRNEAYPEGSIRECALEVLALFVYWPKQLVRGVDIPFERETAYDCKALKEKFNSERQAWQASLELLNSRPGWRDKLLTVWSNVEKESSAKIDSIISNVNRRKWGGMPMDSEAILGIYSERGHLRTLVMHLIAAVTYTSSLDTGDVIPFLRDAFLATKRYSVFAADMSKFIPRSDQDLRDHVEQIAGIARTPMGCPDPDSLECQCSIPELVITAPTALARLLTVLAERDLFTQIPTWSALPGSCAPTTTLAQLQQITGPAVISQLLPLISKRITAQREASRRNVAHDPRVAKDDYCVAAELAAALVSFDKATQGQWRGHMRNAWKELVLSLGNAAEMSNRVGDHETAMGFAIATMGVIETIPPDAEDVTSDVKEKNLRRRRTAREALQRKSRSSRH